MSEPALLREITDDGVVVLSLNRPETMNSINGEINAGIIEAARESKTNNRIRAIVITGAGRGFCSGADLSTGGPARGDLDGSGGGRGRSAMVNKLGPGGLILALAEADVPIIGAINGAAAGAGFGLALSCDVRIASEQARLGSVFIKRGVGPDYGTSFWLPRLVGLARAFELIYSGDLLDAQAALSVGLVNRVVPHDSLMEETMAYARMIASGPPIAYTYTRRAIVRSLDNDLKAQLELEWTNQSELLATRDAREGFAAFRERRAPVFSGE
jgi:2-(1,2-epoxy-1,2-dihydrophenyl)acetyl-CoA isomerase